MAWYKWAALAHDPCGIPPLLGITSDMGRAQAQAAAAVLDGRAEMGHVEEVTSVIGRDLANHYVPTGRSWRGRRTRGGTVRWEPNP